MNEVETCKMLFNSKDVTDSRPTWIKGIKFRGFRGFLGKIAKLSPGEKFATSHS